jgi:hypothetical protein
MIFPSLASDRCAASRINVRKRWASSSGEAKSGAEDSRLVLPLVVLRVKGIVTQFLDLDDGTFSVRQLQLFALNRASCSRELASLCDCDPHG